MIVLKRDSNVYFNKQCFNRGLVPSMLELSFKILLPQPKLLIAGKKVTVNKGPLIFYLAILSSVTGFLY